MTLAPGTRLGPYEIAAPIGAGGMGEVYRARDSRLGRDVAIKTLPAVFALDRDRRQRFESEARAVAALSHPNVLALHDIGSEGDLSYVVMELVEGATLRRRLEDGPLPAARAVPIAIQIAHGLAAAHERGVIHRDLKPENVIITPDGRAKILDFGLAKLEQPVGAGSQSLAATRALGTEPGMVLGTVGYMAPEQVRGQAVDARADLFALGAVLYEMLAGRRAFEADSAADTMSAILREDPPELGRSVSDVPPALDRIVRRCLEKHPSARFQSAADLAFALESLSSISSGAHPGPPAAPAANRKLSFRRLTFRNGSVSGARFTPDGAGIVYGAAWDGKPHEIFTSRLGSPESRSLGLPQSSLLAMSAGGEMAISLGYRHTIWFQVSGGLARVPLAGGGVRPLLKDVGHADWSPDGRTMAVIRYQGGRCLLEYPPGKVLAESVGWMAECRVSPDGRTVAFVRHVRSGELSADLCIVDTSGAQRVVMAGATNINGLCWSTAGDEIWWSGIHPRQEHGIWAADLEGRERNVYLSPVRVTLHDRRADGGVLMSFDNINIGISLGSESGSREQDTTWFDASVISDISTDGSQMLFFEAGEAENPHYGCYVRSFDGSPAVRLGSGSILRFSADGQWAVAVVRVVDGPATNALSLYPTGFGEPRTVTVADVDRIDSAQFHPDGESMILVASVEGRPRRLYRVAIDGGPTRLLWDEEVNVNRFLGLPIAPDGDRIVVRRNAGEYLSYSLSANAAEPVPGLAPGLTPLRFEASGRSLYVAAERAGISRIETLDLASGERTLWRELQPSHPNGVLFVSMPVVAADGSRFAHSYLRVISNLYLVEGLS
jgi:serine/threonine protein kinase